MINTQNGGVSMLDFLLTYAIAVVVFFAIDIIWLAKLAKNLYQKEIGSLLLAKPKWGQPLSFIYFI